MERGAGEGAIGGESMADGHRVDELIRAVVKAQDTIKLQAEVIVTLSRAIDRLTG
jgi:hypothetical protein